MFVILSAVEGSLIILLLNRRTFSILALAVRSPLSVERSSVNKAIRILMAETRQDFHLEIAHVLFMDIVGYSKLLINEQAELLQELNRIVRNTNQFHNAEAAGELIRLPTGDGMALVFLRTAEMRDRN